MFYSLVFSHRSGKYTHRGHKVASHLVASCKWHVASSSYDVPEVRQMYAGYDIIPIQSYSGMNSKKNGSERVLNQEVVIANFNTQTADLLYPQGGQLALQRPLLKLEEPNPEFEIDPKGF